MDDAHPPLRRREFLYRGGQFALLGMVAPGLLAACGGDSDNEPTGASVATSPTTQDDVEGTRLVTDVIDFALTSNEWQGAFGFVTLRLHHAVVEGKDAYFIRTDTSDGTFAGNEGLVFAPKLSALAAPGLSGEMFLFDDDHPAVLSSEPGRKDYTPAWRIREVAWTGSPGQIDSVAALRQAEQKGDIKVRGTETILNAAVVKWSSGELPVDGDLKDYLGGGQLVEKPDTQGLQATFKLHECFPQARYIVVDTSLEPMAVGMNVGSSPMLAGGSKAGATGRTNVFMNGVKGPGPMGFQPSVFDSQAGEEEWSPYWDHMTYAWKKDDGARVLASEDEVHSARDGGELDEFPGTPDTKGEIFTVNCPVPVSAPNTFTG